MKTLNLIFSLMFLAWCISMLIVFNIPAQTFYNNVFQYGFGEKGFNYFWEFIIFATFFNVLARMFNQCNFYLVGAFGFLVLSFTQYIWSFVVIINLIIGYSNDRSRDNGIGQLIGTILTFPYIIFGILSSICCYQTKIHQRINRNQSKLQKCFLKFVPLTNYQNIISTFNVMVSFSSLILFFVVSIASRKFEYAFFIFLSSIFLSILYFLAIKFGKTFLYRLTIFCWGFITMNLVALYFALGIYNISQKEKDLVDIFGHLYIILIFLIYSVIGFFSTLFLFLKIQKKENQNPENKVENQNSVAVQELDNLNDNHQIEEPEAIIYPQVIHV